FRNHRVPLCGVIGGGYSTDVPALAARHAILFEAASRYA
ncbi:MAG: histone deacetylase, partial [Mesorhizobium sp.]